MFVNHFLREFAVLFGPLAQLDQRLKELANNPLPAPAAAQEQPPPDQTAQPSQNAEEAAPPPGYIEAFEGTAKRWTPDRRLALHKSLAGTTPEFGKRCRFGVLVMTTVRAR